MTTRIDELFKLKNITLYYNSLGITEDARRNYVGFTRSLLKEHNIKRSQHAKFSCYKLICPSLEPRKKLTGFEAFLDIEFKCRIDLKSVVTSNPDTSSIYENNDKFVSTPKNYENIVASEIKKETKLKLLYLSGGLDSELLANILLTHEIEFKPVLFQWVDDSNKILNLEEINYAFKFCQKFSITPIVENFNIKDFWQSEELIDMAKELNIGSPHVLTHAKMIMIMNEKFPNYAHYFGGEVRYIVDLLGNNNTKLDIVFSEKLLYNTNYGYPTAPGAEPALSTVYDNLRWGWTRLFIQLQGGGGGGRENYGSTAGNQAGGGGGGGQGRTLIIFKNSADWIVKSVSVTAGSGTGGPANGAAPASTRNSPTSTMILYPDINGGGTPYRTLSSLGGGGAELNGGTGGNRSAGSGGDCNVSNSLGTPSQENETEFINPTTYRTAGSPSNFNGGGGAGSGGTAGSPTPADANDAISTRGGNGGNATFLSQASIPGNPFYDIGYFGPGGGGGGAPGTGNLGGVGGSCGLTFGQYLNGGGNGGDGTAFGNGTTGLGGWGGGGGGAGGGASAGNGVNGQIRLFYWRQ